MTGATAGETLRLFIALNLPAALRAQLHYAVGQAMQPLVRAAPRAVTWVAESSLHLTVRFLGEQPAALVPPLADALASAASAVHLARLGVGGLGAFPSLSRPRVLWIGVGMNVALAALYQKVDDACARLGLGREPRAFHPHVTVGRVRIGAPVLAETLAAAVRALNTIQWTMPVETVDLMSSELAGVARYRRVAAVPLSPPSSAAGER